MRICEVGVEGLNKEVILMEGEVGLGDWAEIRERRRGGREEVGAEPARKVERRSRRWSSMVRR